jgi:hypothetical protein
MIKNEGSIFWFTVGSETHDLVLTGINFETGIVGKSGIEESEGMREFNFRKEVDLITGASAARSGSPLPHPIHSKDSGLIKGRREESGGGVRLVVFRKNDFAGVSDLRFNILLHPEFFFNPEGHRFNERRKAEGSEGEIRFEYAFEFKKRFIIECYESEVVGFKVLRGEAIGYCFSREIMVMFFPCKSFLLSGSDNITVFYEAGGAIMIESRNSKDVHYKPVDKLLISRAKEYEYYVKRSKFQSKWIR